MVVEPMDRFAALLSPQIHLFGPTYYLKYFTGCFSSGRLQSDIPEGLRPHHRRHILPLCSPQSRPQESHRTESSDAHFSAG